MKKIAIPSILSLLLLLPSMVSAADELVFDANTNLTVGSHTLEILSGAIVDQMEVGASSVTFTLSTNSGLTIRSSARKILNNSLGLDVSCSDSYSQIHVSGAGSGSTLTITPSDTVCSATTGSGVSNTTTSSGGGGSAVVATVPTTTNGQVTATASAGGKTTLTTSDGLGATVQLPASAVTASTAVKIASQEKDTIVATRPEPANRSIISEYVYDFTASANNAAVASFAKSLTLTFTYTDAQVGNFAESSLKVFYWKESTSQWVALPTTVNATNNTVTAETDHFTYFTLMVATGSETSDDGTADQGTGDSDITALSDGDLVRNSSAEGMAQFDIYIVKLVGTKKFKRLILSPHVFESYAHFDKNGNGSPWDDVRDVNQATMDQYTVSDLVRAVGDSKVYKLSASAGSDSGAKQWLNMTAETFLASYDADTIYEINATDRDAYQTGAEI